MARSERNSHSKNRGWEKTKTPPLHLSRFIATVSILSQQSYDKTVIHAVSNGVFYFGVRSGMLNSFAPSVEKIFFHIVEKLDMRGARYHRHH